MRLTTRPISSALRIVPTPGRCRSGIHSSSSSEADDLDDPAERDAGVVGDALMEDVPWRQAEPGRDEHADAQAEEGEADDAAAQSLNGPIREQCVAARPDPTDGRVTPSWY